MPATPSTEQVWRVIDKQIFAVLGFVSKNGEARTAGIVYTVRDRQIYIATERESWKARHIKENPHVSLTVTIAKRIPLMPWIKIPPATVTFQGKAAVCGLDEASGQVQRSLFRGLELDAKAKASVCILRVAPAGDFVTYGVGVPLMTMRHPEQACGRAPVGA
ncbi:MAG: pyridoxamine 5'-phosphate oxidase family protein [Acidobacteriia bacterium]|nr:pyridoxamine 5'-phosphate oxidase family protein [Terriglobia bacterium]